MPDPTTSTDDDASSVWRSTRRSLRHALAQAVPTTLTGRLVTTLVAVVAIASILVATTVTLVMRNFLEDKLDHQLEQAMSRTQRFNTDNPGQGGGGRYGAPPGQGAGSITVVFFASGAVGSSHILDNGSNVQLSSAARAKLEDVTPDGKAHAISLPALGGFRVAAIETDGATIVQGLPTKDVDDTIGSLVWYEVLLTVLAVSAAAIGGRFLVRRQLRSLREVAATAHEVATLPLSSGEVEMSVRVPDDMTDPATEVGQVGSALNRLLGHVERALDSRHASEQQVRQFVADASHELRTPLSTIKGYAELTRRSGTDDPEQLHQAMAKVESEAGRMSSLVEDLLLLARLDSGRPLEHDEVDLTQLVVESVNDARVVDRERRWELELPDEPVSTTGDEQRLHQVVTNLLTNASRHTPEGTRVTVTLERVEDRARLTVHDDGPGIPESLQGKVFERFTRGDSSRTRASGGAGLGMSLVHAIVSAHHGTASVTSTPGDTAFVIDLPLHA